MISIIKKKLSLKISILLAFVMVLLIIPVAFWIISTQTTALEELTLEKAKLAANNGAEAYSMILENAIENGILTVNNVFDVDYKKIKGYNWGDSPKFHTKYDFYTDKTAIIFLDSMLSNPDFIYAIGQDINGYVPTHNTIYQKQITGDPGKDLKGNRTKRIFNDSVGKQASLNEKPGFKQIYLRDTKNILWDVSSPVYVKGKHWGCLRIGVSMDRIVSRKSSMLLMLLGLFVTFALLITVTIFILVKKSVKPIEELTQVAKDISLGKKLEEKIRSQSEDEIGSLTKAIDRLRLSLKAAMERLGE